MNYNTIIVILAVVAFVIVFYINEKTKKQNNEKIDNRIKSQLNTAQASQDMIKKAYIYETDRNPFNTTRKSGTTLEYKVFYTLFRYKGKVLSDLYVTNEKGDSTQVDTVFVHNTGIYVIECKDWKCREIYGSQDDNNLKCVYDKGYEKSYGNPFRQNRHHVKYLVGVLKDMCKSSDFVSVVVTECKNIKVDYKSDEGNYYQEMVSYSSFKGYVDGVIKRRDVIFSEEELLAIYKYLHESFAKASTEIKKKHYDKVTKTYDSNKKK